MHHSASKILGQLEAGTGRLTLTLAEDDTVWNPATTSGRPLHGPLKVEYVLHTDGGVDCSLIGAPLPSEAKP